MLGNDPLVVVVVGHEDVEEERAVLLNLGNKRVALHRLDCECNCPALDEHVPVRMNKNNTKQFSKCSGGMGRGAGH